MEGAVRRIDRFQQRHGSLGLIFGVIKKFGDDNAGVLVSNLAYSAFGAIFPLLLLLVTILGLVLRGQPSVRASILHSALAEFPVIGNQLGQNIHALQRGSVLALAVALLGLLWTSTGLAQASLFTMAEIWNVPGPKRPNYPRRLLRSFGFLAVIALGLIVTTTLASFGSFSGHTLGAAIGAELVAMAINTGQFLLAFRVATPKAVATRDLWPGAIAGGVGWTILQAAGGYLVGHELRNQSQVYGTFALVLGLLAWVYMGVRLTVYSAELNTVVARRLWPRAIVQPPLTDADQRSLALQAEQNQRRPEQQVEVGFSEPAMTEEEFLDRQSNG